MPPHTIKRQRVFYPVRRRLVARRGLKRQDASAAVYVEERVLLLGGKRPGQHGSCVHIARLKALDIHPARILLKHCRVDEGRRNRRRFVDVVDRDRDVDLVIYSGATEAGDVEPVPDIDADVIASSGLKVQGVFGSDLAGGAVDREGRRIAVGRETTVCSCVIQQVKQLTVAVVHVRNERGAYRHAGGGVLVDAAGCGVGRELRVGVGGLDRTDERGGGVCIITGSAIDICDVAVSILCDHNEVVVYRGCSQRECWGYALSRKRLECVFVLRIRRPIEPI